MFVVRNKFLMLMVIGFISSMNVYGSEMEVDGEESQEGRMSVASNDLEDSFLDQYDRTSERNSMKFVTEQLAESSKSSNNSKTPRTVACLITPIKFEDTFSFEGGRASGLCSRLIAIDIRPKFKANISKVKNDLVTSQRFSSTNVKVKENVFCEEVDFNVLLGELEAEHGKTGVKRSGEFGDLIGGDRKR